MLNEFKEWFFPGKNADKIQQSQSIEEQYAEELKKKCENLAEEARKLFLDAGVDVCRRPIYIVSQEDLSSLNKQAGRSHLSYTDGMYLPLQDLILIDEEHLIVDNDFKIKRTLVHEYAHAIFQDVFDVNEDAISKYYQKIGRKLPALPAPKKIDLEKLLEKERQPAKKLSVEEIERFEFDRYFDEMFAYAISSYLAGDIKAEDYLSWASSNEMGKTQNLQQRVGFNLILEEVLRNCFYDSAFKVGLANVMKSLPKIYYLSIREFIMNSPEKVN